MAKVLAIIPARSGSVGLPGKNVRALGNRPLLAWAIEAAKEADLVGRVIVDTDSEAYQQVARDYGAETPYLRPKELAEDVPTEDVLLHAVDWLETNQGYRPAVVVCIQCTTPLVTGKDVDNCVGPVLAGEAESALTVAEVSERPEWMFRIQEDGFLYLREGRTDGGEVLKGDWGVRQTFEKLYRPTGGVYAVRTDKLKEERQLMVHRRKPVVTSRLRSFDVDTIEDFMLLTALLKAGIVSEPR